MRVGQPVLKEREREGGKEEATVRETDGEGKGGRERGGGDVGWKRERGREGRREER